MTWYPDIDYTVTPGSYWDDVNPLATILKNVKGTNRRRMIRDFWNAGNLEDLEDALLEDVLSDEQRDSLGAIHPSFMGGEYLPDYRPGEAEIVRVQLNSTNSDVISVRARPVRGLIEYRVVDEYRSDFKTPFTRSRDPLSLRRMVKFLAGAQPYGIDSEHGLYLCYTDMNYVSCGSDLDEIWDFTSTDSEFYPELRLHCALLTGAWLEEQEAAELAAEQANGDAD